MSKVKSADPVPYGPAAAVAAAAAINTRAEDLTIVQALAILERRVRNGVVFGGPADVKDYLRIKLAPSQREIFGVLWLDAVHRVIEAEDLFFGTLTQTSVYPREVVKAALFHNAAACVLYHNHPSGSAEPSRADEYMTATLKQALNLIDVRVLDHIVVGMPNIVSFAERGLL